MDPVDKEDNLLRYFPVLKWVLSGVFVFMISLGGMMATMLMDSKSMQSEMESFRSHNAGQDRKIEEHIKLLHQMHTEQAKMVESLERLNQNMMLSIENANRQSAYALQRLDSYLDRQIGRGAN